MEFKKPTMREFILFWAYCPKCKMLYSPNIDPDNKKYSIAGEWCMDVQFSRYCSAKLQTTNKELYKSFI